MDDKTTTKDDNNEPKNVEEVKNLPEVDEKKVEQKLEEQGEAKYDVSHAPTPHVVHVKKSPVKMILVGLLIFALVGVTGYLGYAYLQEKDNANNLQQQIDTLQSQSNQPTETATEVPAESVTGTVSYNAEVGKFTLSLDKPYSIIKRLDGGFEGGPATKLDIGSISDNSAGVIESSITPTAVYASPKQDSTLEDFINGRNDGFEEVTELASIKIDGVNAKVYRLSGLFDINRVYFESDNNVYEIESVAPESKKDLSVEMNDVIKGFKFN